MRRPAGYAALGALVCAVAAAFAARALYVPGAALVVAAIAATIWVLLSARTVDVTRRLERSVVSEGERLSVEVSVSRGRLALPGGELVPFSGAAPVELRPSRARETVTTDLTPARRGLHELGPARLRLGDPLGLYTREIASASAHVVVLPRVEPVVLHDPGGLGEDRPGPLRFVPATAGVADDALRPHRPGTPAARIHWPTVARTAELIERSPTSETEGLPMVVVDPCSPASEEALDRAVRAAASLCVHLAARGGCHVVLGAERRVHTLGADLRAWPDLHVRLALVDAGYGVPAGTHGDRAGAVLWVTAADPPRPLGMSRAAPSVAYVVTPDAAHGAPASFTVAGCSGRRWTVGATAAARAS